VLHQVEMVAPTGANTLVLGESGTGKELVARAIHQRSPRAKKPLVKVNCGSIPRELFESEFFGHVRGSFTGAVRDRVGRFQLADGGTLFLDEVGEIPLELQTKLLRVLQEGEFEAVGDDRTRRVNVRVIAATNRDLRKEIDAGRFRLDLYYRLAVFPIELPPLRERCEDIPDLLAHFVRLTAAKFHMKAPAIPQREVERARAYAWPGNVRQLQNAVERAVIVSAGGKLALDLPVETRAVVPAPAKWIETKGEVISEDRWRAMEKANIEAALVQCGGKISGSRGAAELLGLRPGTLASRMKVLGVGRRQGIDTGKL
jgi:transcriptional regulator with GAF, ATPase, and Fis domain